MPLRWRRTVDGGWTWGPRFLFPLVPLLMVPLGYFLGSRRNAAVVALLAGLGVGMQILGVTINYSYVYWDWQRMNLTPANAYLFTPQLSPAAMHVSALLEGRYVDLWLIEVLRQFGIVAFVATLLAPLTLLVGGIALLWSETPSRRAGSVQRETRA